jgi:hypothetical protein
MEQFIALNESIGTMDRDVGFLIEAYNNAAKYLHSDPKACLAAARQIAEEVCRQLLAQELALEPHSTMLGDVLPIVKKERLVPHHVAAALTVVHEMGNVGSHPQGQYCRAITSQYAAPCLYALSALADWYVNDYRPSGAIMFTTGPAVRQHLEAARKRLRSNLNLTFSPQAQEIDEQTLLDRCRASATQPHAIPQIFLFSGLDPAIAAEVSEPGRPYKAWDNHVFSLTLPVPAHRSACRAVPLELYYRDDELTRVSEQRKRLFLSSEFDPETGVCRREPRVKIWKLAEFQELIVRLPITILDEAYGIANEHGKSAAMQRTSFAEYVSRNKAPFQNLSVDGFRPLFEVLADILRTHKPTHLTRERRVDAAVPTTCALKRSIELRVQVRFANAPLLGTEEWMNAEQLAQIHQHALPVALNFPIDRHTGQLQGIRLILRVSSPDCVVADHDGEKTIVVPPEQFSPVLTFLLTARHAGRCHVKVEVCDGEQHVLGDIPIVIMVAARAIPPETFPEFVCGGVFTLAYPKNGRGEQEATRPDSPGASVWAENVDSIFKLTQHYLGAQEHRNTVSRLSATALRELAPDHAEAAAPVIPALVNRQARGRIKPVKNQDAPSGFGEAANAGAPALVQCIVPVVSAILAMLGAEHPASLFEKVQAWWQRKPSAPQMSKQALLDHLTSADVAGILAQHGLALPPEQLEQFTMILKRLVQQECQSKRWRS